jgi:hypothetical protein
MKVPTEDQYKILDIFEKEREAIIQAIKQIFAFPYLEETQLVMLEAVTDKYGIGFDAYPHTAPFDRAPMFEEDRGTDIIRVEGVAGGSFYFGDDFDVDALLEEDLLDAYLLVGEKLLVKWLGKRIKEVEGYDAFPYPICICFQGDEPYYYNLSTGTREHI